MMRLFAASVLLLVSASAVCASSAQMHAGSMVVPDFDEVLRDCPLARLSSLSLASHPFLARANKCEGKPDFLPNPLKSRYQVIRFHFPPPMDEFFDPYAKDGVNRDVPHVRKTSFIVVKNIFRCRALAPSVTLIQQYTHAGIVVR